MALSIANPSIVAPDMLLAATVDEIVRMQEYWKEYVLPLCPKVVGDYISKGLFHLAYQSIEEPKSSVIVQTPQAGKLQAAVYVKPINVNGPISIFNKSGGMIADPELSRDYRMNIILSLADAILPHTPNLVIVTHNKALSPLMLQYGYISLTERAMQETYPEIYKEFMEDDRNIPLQKEPPDLFFTNLQILN
jgi:hypothetical protein